MGAQIIGMLCAVLITTNIGAVILRSACWLFNKMAGGGESKGGVPEPGFGRALLITFVTLLVQVAVGFVIGLVLGTGAAAAQNAGAGPAVQLLPSLISLPVGFLVMSGMLTAMLPTSFPRALLVALLEYLIMIAILAVVFGLLMLVFGAAALSGR
jgi:hypothetical protein